MSDAAVETQGVEDNGASGTPTATEEPVTSEEMEIVESEPVTPVEPEPSPEPEADDAEKTRPGLEPDREDDKADEPKPNALDRKLTKENASLRKRLREVEASLKERELAEMSEQERQAKRLVELEERYSAAEQRLRESSLHLSVSSAAQRLNIVDPDAAMKLIDTTILDYDEDGNKWEGIDDALAVLVEERPWLVKPAAPVPTQKESSPANPARRRTRLSREALAKMTDAEIAALPWEDVHAALQSE